MSLLLAVAAVGAATCLSLPAQAVLALVATPNCDHPTSSYTSILLTSATPTGLKLSAQFVI